jgi:16S rRNA (cytosine967-C5)-methyltransferase
LLAPEPRYSRILCDVPCSGTGTLARNPEIRHRLELPALARQAERQQAILLACLRTLRPGGQLVYSTCSLEPEENELVVEAALAAFPKARVLPVEPVLSAMYDAGVLTTDGIERLRTTALAGPYLRTLPGVYPCDGFFAALLTVD